MHLSTPRFGAAPADVVLRPRAAAYAVVRDPAGRVAAVEDAAGCFLPGGGCHAGESPEQTIVREVREELGCNVRLLERVGDAVQIFHAPGDGCWYEMTAVFHRAELVGPRVSPYEFELSWLDPESEGERFFHACHLWAARRR